MLTLIGLALPRVRGLPGLDRLLNRLADTSAQLRVRAALTLALAVPLIGSVSRRSLARSLLACWCG